MIEIDLQQIPNQEFFKIINDQRYDIELRTYDGATMMTITREDVKIIDSVRVVPNQVIIPYPYLTNGGNLYFYCQNNDYPYYLKFGVTQQLVWLTDDEIEELEDDDE